MCSRGIIKQNLSLHPWPQQHHHRMATSPTGANCYWSQTPPDQGRRSDFNLFACLFLLCVLATSKVIAKQVWNCERAQETRPPAPLPDIPLSLYPINAERLT